MKRVFQKKHNVNPLSLMKKLKLTYDAMEEEGTDFTVYLHCKIVVYILDSKQEN